MNRHTSMNKIFFQKLGPLYLFSRAQIIISAVMAFGFFVSGNAHAQSTNLFWNPTNGLGGTGSWSSGALVWSTNSTTGGPILVTSGTSTNNIYNFSGTAGTVSQSSASTYTVVGINWLTSGYIWNMTGSRTFTATDNTATGTNTIYITNNANLTLTSTTGNGVTFEGLSITGGAGSTLTLSNAVGINTTVFLGGTTSTTAGRTNSVNTIIDGAGTMVLGNKASLTGFTQAGNITNNSTGMFVITNSASGSANIAGAISGTGAVTLAYTGSGDISLRGANTYSGNTTIQGGSTNGSVMLYGQNSAFGSGTVTIAGAGTNWVRSMGGSVNITNNIGINSGSIYRLSADNSGWKVTNSGVISGAGSLLLSGTETQILSNTNNSFGGGVTIASSTTVLVNSIGAAGSNSSLGTNGTITFSSLSGGGGPGELYWLGSTSENSDKAIALTTVSTNASRGMKIYAGASGSGGTNVTLALNGNINSTGTNNMTITLGAFNTNTLVMNGTINQAAGYINSLVVGNSGVGTVVLSNTGNSFGGSLTINAGSSSTNTVRVVKIGNAGENSSIGTNGTINIGGGSSSGVNILQYSGSGETNNKVINLAGTTGGATLDQSGTGILKFTSAMTATGAGAKTITLSGSTAGTGEITSGITDLGGNVISVTKSGTGTWVLSGNNTYTGPTVVGLASASSNGILRIAGPSSLSPNTSLSGSTSSTNISTIDLATAGSYVVNSYGTYNNLGNNLSFTASSGGSTTLTFTNATNVMTSGTSQGRYLYNNSSNLLLELQGALDISSSSSNDMTIGGFGDINIGGNMLNSSNGVRSITKVGSGALRLFGTNTYNGTNKVSGGILVMGNSKSLPANTPTVLDGGTLTVSYASGDSDNIGNLSITANSSINLGTGTSASTLKFASGTNWTSGRTLTISNASIGAKLYITDTNNVPLAQIKSAENPNATASLASDGLLTFSSGKSDPVITVAPGVYTYNGASQGPGAGQVNKGGSTGTLTLSYSGTSYGPAPVPPTAAGTYTVTASVLADSTYNAGSSAPISFTIQPKTLAPNEIFITPPSSLAYDGSAKTHAASSTGVSGFSLSYVGRAGTTYGPLGIAPSVVGNYTVTATDTDPNYTGSSSVNFSITAKALTITGATATSRAYNAGTNVVVGGGSLVGVEAGDTANVTLDRSGAAGTVASAAVGTGKEVTVTGYTISGSASGNYSLTQPTGVTVDITAKALTITGATATSRAYDAGTNVVVSGGTLVGVVGSEDVTLGGTPAGTVASAAVGTGKAVTVTGYTISGSASGNYSLSQPTGVTVDITSAGQTISDWLEGAATNSSNVGKYLIGGATNINGVSERPVMTANSSNLVLSAIIRTNDVNYSSNQVVGQWVTNLSQYSNLAVGANTIYGTNSSNQIGLQDGFQRRDFIVPRSSGTNRLFLRLKATLNP